MNQLGRTISILTIGVAAILVPAWASAAPIFVSANAPPGGNGASWNTAFQFLQDALAVASPGDEIRVAQGTYRPDQTATGQNLGNRNFSFVLSNLLTINGGFAGFGAANPDARDPRAFVTILSGDIGVLGDRTDNTFNVVFGSNIDRTAVLDGCTISDGFTGGVSEGSVDGAGVFLGFASPTIRNCIIQDNVTANAVGPFRTAGSGAGLFCSGGSPALIECVIQNNVTGDASAGDCNDGTARSGAPPGDGAGLYFSTNSSTASNPQLINCRILNNRTGAGQIGGSCTTNCTDGTPGGSGAGVWIENSQSALFVNCLIAGNSTGAGGPAGTSTSTPCAGGRGGSGAGVFSANSDVTFINCTIVANVAGLGGSGVPNGADGVAGGVAIIILGRQTVAFTNCILWANVSRGVIDQAAQFAGNPVTVNFSDVQGLANFPGTGNIASDPLFVNAAAGVFTVSATSPVIDVGSNIALPADIFDLDADGNANESIPFDLALQPRVLDGNRDGTEIVDMGCFEFFFDCNNNDIPDVLDITRGTSKDCNLNRIPDECDIASGTSKDCNANGIPDECDIASGTSKDCNHNNIPDECDIAAGTSKDCNHNNIPDECDIAAGTSKDCDLNGVPDECQADTDHDGVIDPCDGCPLDPLKTAPGRCGCGVAETDTDGDGVPDCVDNCPTVYNPDQADTDQDGDGDVCDIDSCFLLCIIHLMEGQGFTDADINDCHCAQNLGEMLAVLRANSGRFPFTEADLLAAAQAAGADTSGFGDGSANRTAASALCPTAAAIALALSLTGLLVVRYRARS